MYCTECNETLTIHADGSIACACQGPLEFWRTLRSDVVPDSWRCTQTDDRDQITKELLDAADAERS